MGEDVFDRPVAVDARLDAAIRAALADGFDCEITTMQSYPMKFACPSAVLHSADDRAGANQGATEVFSPWADAIVG